MLRFSQSRRKSSSENLSLYSSIVASNSFAMESLLSIWWLLIDGSSWMICYKISPRLYTDEQPVPSWDIPSTLKRFLVDEDTDDLMWRCRRSEHERWSIFVVALLWKIWLGMRTEDPLYCQPSGGWLSYSVYFPGVERRSACLSYVNTCIFKLHHSWLHSQNHLQVKCLCIQISVKLSHLNSKYG